MRILLGILSVIIVAIVFAILLILNSLIEMPRTSKKKKNIPFKDLNFGAIALGLCLLALLILTIFSNAGINDLVEGIQVELFGVLFDIIVLIILFNYLNERNLKRERIKRYHEEIDDFRFWHSEESKFKIRGNLVRLQRENSHEIDLSNTDLSGDNSPNGKTKLREFKFDNSKFLQTHLNYCDLTETDITNSELMYTKLQNSQFLHSKLTGNHFQGVKFNKCYLYNCDFTGSTITGSTDFTGADLRFCKFNDAIIESAIFDSCLVSENFIDDLLTWNLKSHKALLPYYVVKVNRDLPDGRVVHEYQLLNISPFQEQFLQNEFWKLSEILD
jgi:uncharacterized protein YjbI with pentapeptide repeats